MDASSVAGRNGRAMLCGLSAVLLWSTAASAFKISLRYLSPFMLLFCSAVVSVVVLAGFYALSGRKRRGGSPERTTSMLLRSALRGILNPFLYYLVLLEAYYRLPAQVAMVVNYLWPVTLVLLSIPLLGQKIGRRGLISVAMGFSGVVVLALGNGGEAGGGIELYPLLLALGSTLAWSLYWILNLRHGGSDRGKLLGAFSFSLIYIAVYGIATGSFEAPDLRGALGGAWVGLFEMSLAYLLWLAALRLSDTTARVGTLTFLAPFLSLFWIAVTVGERITAATVSGLVLVMVGIAIGRKGPVTAAGRVPTVKRVRPDPAAGP